MNWIKQIFSESNGQASSKRVAGMFGWLLVGILIIINGILTESIPTISAEYMYTSAALIGLGSILKTMRNETNSKVSEC